MAAAIEISYFNSFWLKQVRDGGNDPVWPNGYPYNEDIPIIGVAAFPGNANYWRQ
jgi:hypothetical protein